MERLDVIHYELGRLHSEFDHILNLLEENNCTATTDGFLHNCLDETHNRRSEIYKLLELDCEKLKEQA